MAALRRARRSSGLAGMTALRGTDMTDAEYGEVMRAAVTIRQELPKLLPGDAEAFGAALDVHITEAEAAPAGERSAVVGDIMNLLYRQKPTWTRFCELAPALGGAEAVWAADQLLAGEAGGGDPGDQEVSVPCRTCGYVNTLGVYPAADDPPVCQNPEPPRHLLATT
jgi:hypothetical protein